MKSLSSPIAALLCCCRPSQAQVSVLIPQTCLCEGSTGEGLETERLFSLHLFSPPAHIYTVSGLTLGAGEGGGKAVRIRGQTDASGGKEMWNKSLKKMYDTWKSLNRCRCLNCSIFSIDLSIDKMEIDSNLIE